MEYLPNSNSKYKDVDYWDERYKSEHSFEWFGDLSKFHHLLQRHVNKEDSILVLGESNSINQSIRSTLLCLNLLVSEKIVGSGWRAFFPWWLRERERERVSQTYRSSVQIMALLYVHTHCSMALWRRRSITDHLCKHTNRDVITTSLAYTILQYLVNDNEDIMWRTAPVVAWKKSKLWTWTSCTTLMVCCCICTTLLTWNPMHQRCFCCCCL